MKTTKYFKKQVEDWMPKAIKAYRNCVIGNERVYRFGLVSIENYFRDYGMMVKITPHRDLENLDSNQFAKPRNKLALDQSITFIAEEIEL